MKNITIRKETKLLSFPYPQLRSLRVDNSLEIIDRRSRVDPIISTWNYREREFDPSSRIPMSNCYHGGPLIIVGGGTLLVAGVH